MVLVSNGWAGGFLIKKATLASWWKIHSMYHICTDGSYGQKRLGWMGHDWDQK